MQYKNPINPKHVLIATLLLSACFLFLFINNMYSFMRADSVFAVGVEMVTIPFVLLMFAIAIYSGIFLFLSRVHKLLIFISFIFSLLMLVGMCFIE